MDYKDFVEIMCTAVSEELPSDIRVEYREVLKNNGQFKYGIIFNEKNINASPTIYLEYYYELFQNGTDVGDIAKDIVSDFYKNRLRKSIDVDFFSNYENSSERIFCKLINKSMNEELLKDVVYEEFNDLAIVVYCKLNDFDFGNASITIRNSHIEMWNINKEEIINKAKENTRKQLNVCIKNMYEMLAETIEMDSEFLPMYVVTNDEKVNGAIYMIYDDLLDELCGYIGDDYYILPSSIHEFIVVSANDEDDKKYYDEMVKEVNLNHVLPEEILANHAYRYSRAGGFSVWYSYLNMVYYLRM